MNISTYRMARIRQVASTVGSVAAATFMSCMALFAAAAAVGLIRFVSEVW